MWLLHYFNSFYKKQIQKVAISAINNSISEALS